MANGLKYLQNEFDFLFLQEYFSNGQNATKAYLKLKPLSTTTSANVLAHRVLMKVKKSGRLQEYMQNLGLTTEKVEFVLNQFLDSKIKPESIEPDHILRATEQTARILGMNAPEKHVVLTGDLTAILDKIAERKAVQDKPLDK